MEDDPIEQISPTSPPENEDSFDNGNQQNEDFTSPYSNSFFHGKIIGYRPKDNPNQFTIALDDGRTVSYRGPPKFGERLRRFCPVDVYMANDRVTVLSESLKPNSYLN